MGTITVGIKREWLNDQRIVCYSLEGLTVHAMIEWGEEITKTLGTWPSDSKYLAIHDLSKTGVSLTLLVLTGFNILDPGVTPSAQARVETILRQRPKLEIKLAIILPLSMSGQITTKRGKSSNPNNKQIDSRIYNERESALEWLTAYIA